MTGSECEQSVVAQVTRLLGNVLNLGERSATLTISTPLLGALPEFDSMAVVNVIAAIEDRFGIVVDDDEVSAQTFESVATLVSFVDAKLS